MSHSMIEQHLSEGRLDQAESLALHVLDRDPKDVSARTVLARVAAMRGRVDDAMAALEALAKQTKSPEPQAYLAHYLAQGAQTDEARAHALALAHDARARGAHVPVAHALVGDEARAAGNFDGAMDLYDAALAIDPRLVGALIGRGAVLRERDELAEAEDALASAVQYGPERVDAWIDLVVLERDAGAEEAARENLMLALQNHPGHPELLEIKAGFDKDRPVDEVDEALIDVRRRIRESDFAGAQGVVTRLISGARDDPRTLLARSEIIVATDDGDVTTLVHDLMRVVRQEPMGWEYKTALGRVLLRTSVLQNPRLAVHYCEDAWRASGEHPRACLGLIEAWATVGKLAFARALCERIAGGVGPEAEAARTLLYGETQAPEAPPAVTEAPARERVGPRGESVVPRGENYGDETLTYMPE